jgi:hypothetical protein
MEHHPIPFDEHRRQRVLDASHAIDAADEKFRELTSAAAARWAVPIATVSLIDRDRQCFKGVIGLEADGTSRDVAFCAHTIMGERALVVLDAREDPRFHANPLVTGEPGIRFYAGFPIKLDGAVVGAFCLIDKKPRASFSDADEEALAAHAVVAGRIIESIRLDHLLKMPLAEQLRSARENRRASDSERAAFLAVISHELRTPLNAISGFTKVLLDTYEESQPSEQAEFLELIDEGANQLKTITESALAFAAADFGVLPIDARTFRLRDAAASGLRWLGITEPDVDHLHDHAVKSDEGHARQIFASVTSALFNDGAEHVALRAEATPDGGLKVTFAPTPIHAIVGGKAMSSKPFDYDDNVLARGQKGLELDLPLADRLAKALGCRLEISQSGSQAFSIDLLIPPHLAIV